MRARNPHQTGQNRHDAEEQHAQGTRPLLAMAMLMRLELVQQRGSVQQQQRHSNDSKQAA